MESHGKIKLTKTPEDFSGLESAYNRLAAGEETETTPADENLEVVVPVQLDGMDFELVCKDYGGEQVKNITELMEFDKTWINRAKSNDRWIFFIRLSEIYKHYDLSAAGYAKIDEMRNEQENEPDLSDQYHFIELLQTLLHARDIGIKAEIDSPKLLIVLTCWDELENPKELPAEILSSRLPLFHHFVKTIWSKGSVETIGLSSQEFPLDTQEAKDKYLDELPESFGYLILPDGKKEKDLTKLIELAVKL